MRSLNVSEVKYNYNWIIKLETESNWNKSARQHTYYKKESSINQWH